MAMLSNVVSYINSFTEMPVYRPSNGLRFYTDVHLINIAVETSRKNSFYDRIGVLNNENDVVEGDILNDKYIISSLISDVSFGETVRYNANLIYGMDTVSVIRKTISKDATTGIPTDSETVVYSDVMVGLRSAEFGLVNNFQTVRDIYYVIISSQYDVQAGDIIRFDNINLEDFFVETIKPFERGTHMAYSKENRV